MSRRRLLRALLLAASGAVVTSAPFATVATRPELQDIRAVLPTTGLPAFALTGAALLLVGGLFLAFRHARDPARPPPPPAARAPDARSLLARLADAYRAGGCPGDQLILHLDGLVRDTLTARSDIPAHSLTSVELRHALSIQREGGDAGVGAASAAIPGPANTFAPEGAPTANAPPFATAPVGAASAANDFAPPGFAAEAAPATIKQMGAVTTEIGGLVARFLVLCDRVKFAGHRPSAVEIDEALRTVAELLDVVSAGHGR